MGFRLYLEKKFQSKLQFHQVKRSDILNNLRDKYAPFRVYLFHS